MTAAVAGLIDAPMASPMLTIGVWVCALSTSALATLGFKHELSQSEDAIPVACEKYEYLMVACLQQQGSDPKGASIAVREKLEAMLATSDPATECGLALADAERSYKNECPILSR